MSRNSALDYVRGSILIQSEKSWSDLEDKSFKWRQLMIYEVNSEVRSQLEIFFEKILTLELSDAPLKCESPKLKKLYNRQTKTSFTKGIEAILLSKPDTLRRLFFDSEYSPQDHTLDVLAIYCGCVGWKDLEKKFRKNELQDIEKLCQLGIILNSGELRKIPLEKTSVNSQSSVQPFKQLFTKKRVLLLIGLIILIWVYIYFHDSTSSQNKIHYDELQPVDTIQSQ